MPAFRGTPRLKLRRRVVLAATASAAYTFRAQPATSAPNSQTRTFSVDIGTASADRLVIVSVLSGFTTLPSTVTAAGISLTMDVSNNGGNQASIWSGVVNSGDGAQNIVITFPSGAAFQTVGITVWTATGLLSNTVRTTANSIATGNLAISVTATDFLFNTWFDSSSIDFNGSTQAPAANHYVNPSAAADWTIVSTNAAFSIVPSGVIAQPKVAATYR